MPVFYRINFAPVVCACVYFYTAFGYLPRSFHKKHLVYCLSSCTSRSLSSLSGLSAAYEIASSSKIQTIFFPSCAIKASACKISQAKTKDDSAKLAPDGKINDIWNKELMLQIDPFLYQVNVSFLLLEVCFQFLSVLH